MLSYKVHPRPGTGTCKTGDMKGSCEMDRVPHDYQNIIPDFRGDGIAFPSDHLGWKTPEKRVLHKNKLCALLNTSSVSHKNNHGYECGVDFSSPKKNARSLQ